MSDNSYDTSQLIDAVQSGGLTFGSTTNTWEIPTGTSIPVLAYNGSRKCFILHNAGDSVYVKFGLGVSADSFSLVLRDGKFMYLGGWGGPVSVMSAGSSTCNVTEIY